MDTGRLVRIPATVALVAAAACSGPGGEDAAEVVTRFYAAIDAGDGAAACGLLLPAASASLEHDAGLPCAEAIVDPASVGPALGERAGSAGVADVHRAGGQAQVVTAADTVFLALSGDSWVVTAVGCDPRGDLPYDCEVES